MRLLILETLVFLAAAGNGIMLTLAVPLPGPSPSPVPGDTWDAWRHASGRARWKYLGDALTFRPSKGRKALGDSLAAQADQDEAQYKYALKNAPKNDPNLPKGNIDLDAALYKDRADRERKLAKAMGVGGASTSS